MTWMVGYVELAWVGFVVNAVTEKFEAKRCLMTGGPSLPFTWRESLVKFQDETSVFDHRQQVIYLLQQRGLCQMIFLLASCD